MSDKRPPKDRLSAEDVDLWKRMTGDVDRADGRDYLDIDVDLAVDDADSGEELFGVRMVAAPPLVRDVEINASPPVKRGVDIDARTAEKLRKGEMRPEARLDLHGMGQGQARVALHAFIVSASAQGLRCVLVITGKGKTGKLASREDWYSVEPGILKRRVPDWLREGAAAPLVLQYTDAQPADGGTGALYVYLRRMR